MSKINVLQPKFRTAEILNEIKECLEKGWTGMGFKTVEFEEEWKKYTQLPFAHFISSNTVGLHLALNIFKNSEEWNDGDEIITTPITFVSTNHSILYERLTPVFADVDEYLCLNPESVKEKITEKTRAVMFVGMGGNAGRLDKIKKICKNYNLKLILDAAHMAGTKTKKVSDNINYTTEHVGWEADVSIFSFQAVKNLPTADSGMVCFKEEKFDKLVRQLSWLGIDKDTYSRTNEGSYKWKYYVPNVGFKYHGNSVMAAIGLVQLKYLDEDNQRRNEIAKFYNTHSGFVRINNSPHTKINSRHLYQILVDEDNRDNIIKHLYDNGIYPGVHYLDNTIYPMYNKSYGSCPKAHKLSNQLITLPIHLNLTDEDCEYVIKKLKEKL